MPRPLAWAEMPALISKVRADNAYTVRDFALAVFALQIGTAVEVESA
jgi:hypothetical protein